MAKINTPRGKLVRKFGENIFGNPKYDRLLNRKPYEFLTTELNFKKSKKLSLCMDC